MKQSEIKQKRLMEKARELFWTYGYNGVSIDQIANEAGISKMTIYKHCSSKEDLFLKTLIEFSDPIFDDIIGKMIEIDYTLEKVEFFYKYTMSLSKSYPAILIKDIMERSYILEKLTAYKRQKSLFIWNYILEDGIKKEEIRNLDIDFVSNLLLDLPTIFINSDYLQEDYRDKLINNFFDFIKYGLLGGIDAPLKNIQKEEIHFDEGYLVESRKS